MIALDTNYLIHGLITGTDEAARISLWLDPKESIGMPAIAWYEFLCGPVSDEDIHLARAILTAGVLKQCHRGIIRIVLAPYDFGYDRGLDSQSNPRDSGKRGGYVKLCVVVPVRFG